MPRYKLTLEYDGTPFVGWQRQAAGVSVQSALEDALHAFCGENPGLRAAGRTDAGVHALAQVAHIDLARDWPTDRIRDGLTFHLKPDPIAVLECRAVTGDFDSRFSARARHYVYRIVNRSSRLALDSNRAWLVRKPLDADAMNAAASRIVGRHDFTTFRAAGCQATSPIRTLDRLAVTRTGDEIRIEASARSFLHNQVRSMVGSLKLVGEGRWTPDDMAAALAAADRTRCGPVAPACGLYLARVDYAE